MKESTKKIKNEYFEVAERHPSTADPKVFEFLMKSLKKSREAYETTLIKKIAWIMRAEGIVLEGKVYPIGETENKDFNKGCEAVIRLIKREI